MRVGIADHLGWAVAVTAAPDHGRPASHRQSDVTFTNAATGAKVGLREEPGKTVITDSRV